MNPHFIADLVTVLESIQTDEAVKRQIRNGLFRVGRMHGVRDLNRLERHRFALDLLRSYVSRSTIAGRLMACFGIAKRQAYRDIEDALRNSFQLCHLEPLNGTTSGENNSIEERLGVEHDGNSGQRESDQGGDG